MYTQTGVEIYPGKGSMYLTSRKQKSNTKSFPETEVTAVNDPMPQAIWTQ